mgnify:CR=1 FL=1
MLLERILISIESLRNGNFVFFQSKKFLTKYCSFRWNSVRKDLSCNLIRFSFFSNNKFGR